MLALISARMETPLGRGWRWAGEGLRADGDRRIRGTGNGTTGEPRTSRL